MLKAGFGRTDITPKLGVHLGGYNVEERSAKKVFNTRHSTVMLVEHDITKLTPFGKRCSKS